MAPAVSVIVPTFREAENLPALIPRIALALSGAGYRGEIVIVDDDSQDGSVEVCRGLAERYPVLLLVRRQERGLSSAVLHGMRHAHGEVFVVMDADLSHPPERIPELVAALDDNAVDFAIGSRYVAGGRTDRSWGILRWLNSKVATLMARPFTRARDPMAGFFAIRRGTFAQGDEISPIGYKIGLELMVKCGCRNIREIPIHFRDRTLGQSKLSLREQLHYLLHVVRLLEYRFEPLACPAKFCLVGATGMAVDLAALALLLDFLPLPVSRGLAIWGAMTWNFTLNRHFTFRGERQRDVVKQYGLFCASCLAGALVNWGVSVGLGRGVPFCGRHLLFAAGLGVIAGTGLNYLFSRYVTFRRRTGLGNDAPA